MRSLPRLLLTGASGFLARYVIRALKDRYRIVAIDRWSRGSTWVPPETELEWHQVDLAEADSTRAVFRQIAAEGGAETAVHLAAYYDFDGDDSPEYERTNIRGLRHVLDGCRELGLRGFVFASSAAACAFPRPGEAIDETSPPDGDHRYAETKRMGEAMLDEYRDAFPSVIVRFAAMYSDWCEYPPLYHFLATWLSRRWNANLLGGRGDSAVPYLHVRDGALFLRAVTEKLDVLDHGEVLLASPDGSISHRQLYEAATREFFDGGSYRSPRSVPRPLCRPGIWILDRLGQAIGDRPFERPWMAEYVDQRLTVDASRTRERLGWEPRTRLEVLHRMPFLIENFRTDPVEWERRNRHVMESRRVHPNLRVYQLIQDHSEEILDRFVELLATGEAREWMPHYQGLPADERLWNHRLILRNLLHAVRTRRKGLFMAYCRDLAERRAALGFQAAEVIYALDAMHHACHDVLCTFSKELSLSQELHDTVIRTIRFGIDQVEMVYEALQGRTIELPEHVAAAQREAAFAPPPRNGGYL